MKSRGFSKTVKAEHLPLQKKKTKQTKRTADTWPYPYAKQKDTSPLFLGWWEGAGRLPANIPEQMFTNRR